MPPKSLAPDTKVIIDRIDMPEKAIHYDLKNYTSAR